MCVFIHIYIYIYVSMHYTSFQVNGLKKRTWTCHGQVTGDESQEMSPQKQHTDMATLYLLKF